jgi:hypothetical protein
MDMRETDRRIDMGEKLETEENGEKGGGEEEKDRRRLQVEIDRDW